MTRAEIERRLRGGPLACAGKIPHSHINGLTCHRCERIPAVADLIESIAYEEWNKGYDWHKTYTTTSRTSGTSLHLAERLAREAVPCECALRMPNADFDVCGNCEHLPAVQRAIECAIEACLDAAATAKHGDAAISSRIRALLTEQETT